MNAQREKVAILHYWVECNGSTAYSAKLDEMFRSALSRVAQHPKLGRSTSDPDVRMKVVGEFEIFYSLTQDTVHVLSVWRGTRDPVGRPY